MNLKINAMALIVALGLPLVGCQRGSLYSEPSSTNSESEDPQSEKIGDVEDSDSHDIADHIQNDIGLSEDIQALGCVKASSSQKKQVNLGLDKKEEFLQKCAKETNGSFWCDQLARPNPRSSNTFKCTYGSSQSAHLIHPDEKTWKYPIEGVKILHDLSAKGIKISQIYNWWRPEPYNKNVGGAAGRHPYGTSIDVRFASNSEADRAFRELCKMRRAKRLRAIGHYGSASLHIGVGDKTANTWGKSCN